ncbi:DUF6648 family protein [Anaerosphaera multitolerans]|uniref:Uncharacterized protein n=1 Tax=Anaerosphaera multitolerans TaxID=2487351 RepID=A0A437S7Y9_9FIRM|nr:DUF6648 family protein [Anaerosphaera multitolerans]RVU55186.1 hypothetical protein EF514_02630 [Anaerosphaera multitolerans]
MNYVSKANFFEDFFKRRSYLIEKYSKGDITKGEFLKYNFDYFNSVNARPFLRIDSFEKGIYNYQYFNGLAKYYKMLAKEVKNTKKRSRYYNYYLNLGNKYYQKKDESVLTILELQNFTNIQSYYIKCDSNFLKNSLYEIVLIDKREAIFHSKADWLLNVLKEKKIFDDEIKTSLIEEYINEKY